MRTSFKAALLSALVLPGVGHVFLRHYLRGSVLVCVALAALAVIMVGVVQRALTIVDGINSGDIPLDALSITQMVSNSAGGTDGSMEGVAVIVLGVCWLIGIIDSYRLGRVQDKSTEPQR